MQWELTLLFLATKRKEEDRNNPNLASARGKWPYMFEIWWLMGVCCMFGGCLKGVGRGSYYEMSKGCVGCLDVSEGQINVWSLKILGQVKPSKDWSSQFGTYQIK